MSMRCTVNLDGEYRVGKLLWINDELMEVRLKPEAFDRRMHVDCLVSAGIGTESLEVNDDKAVDDVTTPPDDYRRTLVTKTAFSLLYMRKGLDTGLKVYSAPDRTYTGIQLSVNEGKDECISMLLSLSEVLALRDFLNEEIKGAQA